jgi:hypothetical protein
MKSIESFNINKNLFNHSFTWKQLSERVKIINNSTACVIEVEFTTDDNPYNIIEKKSMHFNYSEFEELVLALNSLTK